MPILHPIAPVYDNFSEILILGSFPSVKSREEGFFYGHRQNRFWRVMATLYGADLPQTVQEKKVLLLHNHIALWDVIASCDIEGSSDASIQNARVNDLSPILKTAPIRRIYTNGKKAQELYNRYMRETVGKEAAPLPSTSPANAQYSLERLVGEWKQILIKQQEKVWKKYV